MAPKKPRPERRQERSDNVLAALELQLSSTVRQAGLRALVLADDLGLMVAGIGRSGTQERLAALAPQLVSGSPTFHGRVGKARTMLSVATVTTIHGPLYLAAVGGAPKDIPKALFGSGRGVSRILGAWQ